MKPPRVKLGDYKMEKYFQTKYGISIADYIKMYKAQDGKCAICRKDDFEFRNRLAVDHDHSKDGNYRARGLVCFFCNFRVIGRTSKRHVVNLIKYYTNAYPELFDEDFVRQSRRQKS